MAKDVTTEIAEGLAIRLRTLARSIDRLDRLESGSGEWLANFHATELPDAATELMLRALRTAADPVNYHLLVTLSEHPSRSLTSLLETTPLTRLPLTEHLNDLVQVGLASRLIDTDHAQITAAGAELTAFIRHQIAEMIKISRVNK